MKTLRILLLAAVSLLGMALPAMAQTPHAASGDSSVQVPGDPVAAPQDGEPAQAASAGAAPEQTDEAGGAQGAAEATAAADTTQAPDTADAPSTTESTKMDQSATDEQPAVIVVVDESLADLGADCEQTDTCGTGHHAPQVQGPTETPVHPAGPPPVVANDVTEVGGIVIERPQGAAAAPIRRSTDRRDNSGPSASAGAPSASRKRIGAAEIIAAPHRQPRLQVSLAQTGLPSWVPAFGLVALLIGFVLVRAGGAVKQQPATWSLPAARS